MKFLVTDINNPSNVRVIEGTGFRFEDNRCVIVDKQETVASLLNVNIEPISSTRESSKKLVGIAQRYRNFQASELFVDTVEEREKVAEEIRSLAGSVLSQASQKD